MDKKDPVSGTLLSGRQDHEHALEEDPTYSTIDDREWKVVVLSDNPAYSKYNHAHSNIELSAEQESGLGAGRGGTLKETATTK